MLTFIFGSPGSGKTEEIIRRIGEDIKSGIKVLYLVPEQEAVSAERRISEVYNSSPSLFLLDVANFRRLSNIVFRNVGGLCYNYIDKGGQAIMMWRVLSELSGELNTYKPGESTDIGLVSSLLGLFDEFADYRIDPITFENAVAGLEGGLERKAIDIAMLYTRYNDLIHEGYSSAKDDLKRVASLDLQNDIFADTKVYIDSFSGFTPAEYAVIDALICSSLDVTVSLCVDNERDDEIFSNLIKTKNKIASLANARNKDVLSCFIPGNYRAKEFEFFAKYCFDSVSGICYDKKPERILQIAAKNKYEECELVCADIAKHLRMGYRYRDFRIVCGDQNGYKGVIDSMLLRHGIPCHFSGGEDLSQQPCVKLIISALNIIAYNWRLYDVIAYIKTGLCGVSDEDCDLIEEYITTWSISGYLWRYEQDWNMNPSGYSEFRNEEDNRKLIHINSIRDELRKPVLQLAERLNSNSAADAAARALYEFLCQCIDQNELKGEKLAAWNTVVTALEQLYTCGKDIPINDIETLKRLIKLLSSQTSFSLIPATIDQVDCISLGNASSSSFKRVYIIGANDGSFPAVYKDDRIMGDELRSALCNRGLTLPHDPKEMYDDQLWLFYKCLLSATEGAWISWCTSDLEGGELLPSASVYEIQKLFPLLPILKSDDISIIDRIYDKESAFDYINNGNHEIGDTIRCVLSDDEYYKEMIGALSVPIETELCSITDAQNLLAYKGDLNLTQTRIDNYVKCKFAYRLQYGLKLNEQRKVEYDPRDIGNFIHILLERYFKEYVKAEKSGSILTDEQSVELVNKIVDEYVRATCGDLNAVSKRMLAMFERLRRQAIIYVRSIRAEFSNSDFKPAFFELPINKSGDDTIPPCRIELSDGTGVYIYGQIDRVDTFEKDGKVYLRIVDYKTGKKEFKRDDLEKGLNLQMFLYLLSITENKERFCDLVGCNGELIPCGALYYMAKIVENNYDTIKSDDEIEADVIKSIQRQGMILDDCNVMKYMSNDESDTTLPIGISFDSKKTSPANLFTIESLGEIQNRIKETVSKIAESMKRGDADAVPMKDSRSPCEYCRMKVICRKADRGGDELNG